MTVYATNYANRMNEMLANLQAKLGKDDERVALFKTYHAKLINQANYKNREFMERLYRSYMR